MLKAIPAHLYNTAEPTNSSKALTAKQASLATCNAEYHKVIK